MFDEVLAKEIINADEKEKKINPIEIKMYYKLINVSNENDDNKDIANDIFNQLIENKEVKE